MKDNSVIVHPDIRGDNVKVPQVGTIQGAGFGDSIVDSDRAFSACREPVAHFLTYGVSEDITEKWFIIDNPDTDEADPELNRSVQKQLKRLSFQRKLTQALVQSRIYGKALLVGGFGDAKNIAQLKQPLRRGAELLQLEVYPRTVNEQKVNEFWVETKEENPESPRYGEPLTYKIDRGGGNYLYIHYTRVCEVGEGYSILNPIWDDLTCGRNIRWGSAQWMYRTGSGFPVFEFPAGTSGDDLEAMHESGIANNLMARTAIFIAQNSQTENDGMKFHFEGASGRALDPTPFFKTNLEQIAISTGIPQAKLIGAQAGTVSGSDVNVQDYFKVVSREQERHEYVVRWVIDHLALSGQLKLIKAATDEPRTRKNSHINLLKKALTNLTRRDYRRRVAEDYEVNWLSAFELSELEEAQIENLTVQANVNKLKYMTKDEVRINEGLDPLPDGEGSKAPGSMPFNLMNPQEPPEEEGESGKSEGDRYLVVDLGNQKFQSKPKPCVEHDHST